MALSEHQISRAFVAHHAWAAALVALANLIAGGASAETASERYEPGLYVPALPGRPAPQAKTNCDAGSQIALPGETKPLCGVFSQQPSCVPPGSQSPAGPGDENKPACDVYLYKGIKYANAARWKPSGRPDKPGEKKGEGIGKPLDLAPQDATGFGAICPQTVSETARPLTMDEDCLFLNVWKPVKTYDERLPVMVFIHGGAFVSGAGSDLIYDASSFARRGAVVVTFNYRLGALGFLRADNLRLKVTGNLGLLDQQVALRWVKENISRFGGDAGRVMLFGESAGAMSVALHTFSVPSSGELFAAALMESNVAGSLYPTKDRARAIGDDFVKDLCEVFYHDHKDWCRRGSYLAADWFDRVEWNKIVAAQSEFFASRRRFGEPESLYDLLSGQRLLNWTPVVDDKLVEAQPYEGFAKGVSGKPVGIGVNQNEADMFVGAMMGALRISEDHVSKYGTSLANMITDLIFSCGNLLTAQNALERAPVYAYYFTHPAYFSLVRIEAGGKEPMDAGLCDPDKTRACHAVELPYVFDTLETVDKFSPETPAPDPKAEKELAEKMNAAWFEFAVKMTSAKTDKSPYTSPAWKPFDKTTNNAVRWHDNRGPDAPINLDAEAACSNLWFSSFWYKKLRSE